MKKVAFLLTIALLIFGLPSGFCGEPTSKVSLPNVQEDIFITAAPFIYSYQEGQWISSRPGKIFTTGSYAPDFTLPSLKGSPKPIRYPRWALNQGWQGRVVVAIEIREDGAVGRWKIMQSSGFPLLDEVTVASIRKWSFESAREGEKPIVSCVQIPVRFVIER